MKVFFFLLLSLSFHASAESIKDEVISHLAEGEYKGENCTVSVAQYFSRAIVVGIWQGKKFENFSFDEKSSFHKLISNHSTTQVLEVTTEVKPDNQYTSMSRFTLKIDNKLVSVTRKNKGLFGFGKGKTLTCQIL